MPRAGSQLKSSAKGWESVEKQCCLATRTLDIIIVMSWKTASASPCDTIICGVRFFFGINIDFVLFGEVVILRIFGIGMSATFSHWLFFISTLE